MAKGKPGAPKKYKNAGELGAAVNAYFSSLQKKSGEFKRPPSLAGMCLYLGISRQTFWNYANGSNKGMAFVAETAKLVVEDFWSGQLAGKWAQGAKFALGCGFGWNKDGQWSDKSTERAEEESGGVIEIPQADEETPDE